MRENNQTECLPQCGTRADLTKRGIRLVILSMVRALERAIQREFNIRAACIGSF
jgi:hypothetical protein